MNGVPNHVAVVPNGNRRGSVLARMSLPIAYMRGAQRALELAGWAREAGVRHLTFFGLSCENLKNRRENEIDALMEGAIYFFDRAVELGFRLDSFGKIYEFEGVKKYEPLYQRLEKYRGMPHPPDDFVIHVAANYSGVAEHELAPLIDALYNAGFDEVRKDPARYLLSGGIPPVDLFIRTGGEHRTSGLLPFQASYAELYFTKVLWGDFVKKEFLLALQWFAQQQRNFGK